MSTTQTFAAAKVTQFPGPALVDIDSQDSRFLRLFSDLRPYGGMLPIEEVRSIGFVQKSGLSLGESLMQRNLFALTWRHRLWLPMFQLRMPSWTPSPNVSHVAGLMHPVLQGYDLAEWFISPNGWLDAKRPIDLIDKETANVCHAARADRFVLAS